MFSTPEILLLALFAIGLLISANQHGKPKEGTNSFWSSIIALAIQVGLMYWAGLFHGQH